MSNNTFGANQWNRRNILRLGAVASAATAPWFGPVTASARASRGAAIEPNAVGWKTWVLTNGRQMRLAAPPDQAASAGERRQMAALAAQRDEAALDRINYWDAGSPGYRWNELALQQTLSRSVVAHRAADERDGA